MKKFLMNAVLIFVVAFSTSAYGSEERSNPLGWYGGLGGVVALEDFDINFPDSNSTTLNSQESWGINGRLGYRFNDYFSVELDVNYLFKFEFDVQMTSVQQEFEVTPWTIMPAIKVSSGSSRINPYFVAGLGYMNVDVEGNVSPSIQSAITSLDNSDLAAKLGLGIDFFTRTNFSIGIEGDYFFGFGDLNDIRYYNFMLGVCYYFRNQ
jgi:opacity protein-like surface antigen